MNDSEHYLRVWPGERQLLPSAPNHHDLLLHCRQGKAYLRIMSDIQRHLLESGSVHKVPHGEVATLSGIEKTVVTIEFVEQEKKPSDC